jgi:hypothetical protein
VTTLRFHRDIYPSAAVAEAVAVFAEYGQFSVDESDPGHVVVRVVASDGSQEDALAGTFANYALGASAHAHQRQAG